MGLHKKTALEEPSHYYIVKVFPLVKSKNSSEGLRKCFTAAEISFPSECIVLKQKYGPHILATSCPSAPMSKIHCVFSNREDLLFTSGRQPRETAVAYNILGISGTILTNNPNWELLKSAIGVLLANLWLLQGTLSIQMVKFHLNCI